LAAQAWCKDKTKHIEMDSDLAEAFAEILDPYILDNYVLEKIICPIMSGPVQVPLNTSCGTGYQLFKAHCQTEQCAWFQHGRCAVYSLSSTTGMMFDVLVKG
jgi:hypothetical protein